MPFHRRNIHQGSHLSLFQALPRPPSQDPSEVVTLRTRRMPFHRRNIHQGSLPSLFQALPRTPSQDPSEVVTLRTHRTTIPCRNLIEMEVSGRKWGAAVTEAAEMMRWSKVGSGCYRGCWDDALVKSGERLIQRLLG